MKKLSIINIIYLGLTIFLASQIPLQARPTVGTTTNPPNSRPNVGAKTTFNCIPYSNGQFATVGQRGGKTVPLVIWTQQGSSYFGEQYTPQVRCNAVTQKLNKIVGENGGTMKNLVLSHGSLNGQTVVCVLRPSERSCNTNNSLFTLKPENAKKAGIIITQMMNISQYGSSSGVVHETSGQTYVSLESWENQNFSETDNTPNPPNTPNTPTPSTPSTPSPPNNETTEPTQPNSSSNGDWSL